MDHVEIEDFYHHDFTTVSEWEVFIARLEEIMHEWKLSHARIAGPLKSGDFLNCQWHEASEKINFAGSRLTDILLKTFSTFKNSKIYIMVYIKLIAMFSIGYNKQLTDI